MRAVKRAAWRQVAHRPGGPPRRVRSPAVGRRPGAESSRALMTRRYQPLSTARGGAETRKLKSASTIFCANPYNSMQAVTVHGAVTPSGPPGTASAVLWRRPTAERSALAMTPTSRGCRPRGFPHGGPAKLAGPPRPTRSPLQPLDPLLTPEGEKGTPIDRIPPATPRSPSHPRRGRRGRRLTGSPLQPLDPLLTPEGEKGTPIDRIPPATPRSPSHPRGGEGDAPTRPRASTIAGTLPPYRTERAGCGGSTTVSLYKHSRSPDATLHRHE